MKNRSPPQSAAPPEDWVDGSWTVDCICDVNFDDGQEMVHCDVCGVWEHTRCSRYVKGQEEFACSECKGKNNGIDSEETEVAQLLVELPTKIVPAKRSPLRFVTDIEYMEERVHVQGIPGGDPELFSGLSPVFSQQLWKCTGYVPQKLNFQYREFAWDGNKNKEGDAAIKEEDNENAVDKCANLVDKESNCDDYGCEKMKETEILGVGDNVMKKEKTLNRPILIHSRKRKKRRVGHPQRSESKKEVSD